VKFTQLFINNRFVNSSTLSTYATVNAMSGEMTCRVQHASMTDVNEAVLTAKNAFKSNSVWKRMNASMRARLLNKLSDLIERDIDYITDLETIANGVVFSVAYNRVQLSVQCLRYIAELCDKLYGKAIPIVGPYFAFTRLEPIGVCGSVFEGNSSVILIAIQIGVVLAAGNTLVIKLAEQTPFTALHLASLISEAGFPPGMVNIISGSNKTAGTAICEHRDVNKVSFYCSKEVINQNNHHYASERIVPKHALIEMLPTVAFGEENKDLTTFNTARQKTIKLRKNERQVFNARDMLDESVKKSIELAAKRIVCYPINGNTERSIDVKYFNKIVSYIMLFTKKCILF